MAQQTEQTIAQLKALLAERDAKIADMEKAIAGGGKLSYKVSVKGALSCYGLQRMPMTFYLSQLERFENDKPNRDAFIAAHKGEFAVKPSAQSASAQNVGYVKPSDMSDAIWNALSDAQKKALSA